MNLFLFRWCWVLFRTCFQELTKWLLQGLRRLWRAPWVRRFRWLLTLTFKVIAAMLILWKVKRLLSGQIDWSTLLDDLADEFIASLIFH